MISLRVDWLVREHRLVAEERLGGGYVFADFGPSGGELVVLSSGPPWTVLGCAPLPEHEARRLAAAADDGAVTLHELDQLLVALCRGAVIA